MCGFNSLLFNLKMSMMNILLIMFILLSTYVRAQQCAFFAEGIKGSCICIQGYYSTNAEYGGNCNICPIGSYTAPPSFEDGGNTNPKADSSVCNICYPGFYMTAAASLAKDGIPAIAAQCNSCPQNTGNNGVSSVGDVSQCNICLENYYQIADAIPGSQTVFAAAVSCQACPKDTVSPVNSKSSNACIQIHTTSSKLSFVSLAFLILQILV
ncbi:hypothetical protein ABPG72_001105 [Tetrahymena utriculariae]